MLKGRTRTASQKILQMRISKLGDVVSKLVQLKRITDGGLEAKPPAAVGYGGLRAKPPVAGQFFCDFLKKIALLMPFGLHFTRFQSHLQQQNF